MLQVFKQVSFFASHEAPGADFATDIGTSPSEKSARDFTGYPGSSFTRYPAESTRTGVLTNDLNFQPFFIFLYSLHIHKNNYKRHLPLNC